MKTAVHHNVAVSIVLICFLFFCKTFTVFGADFSGQVSCPVCSISFSSIVETKEDAEKKNFDGRPGDKKFLPLPECPMCGGVFSDRTFSEDEKARLHKIIWSKEFQDSKKMTTYARFALLLEKLEADDSEVAQAWLKAAWAEGKQGAAGREELIRSLAHFIEAHEILEKFADGRFEIAVKVIDILRQLSRFSEAEQWIKKALSERLPGSRFRNHVLRELLALIRAENSKPAEMPVGNFLSQAIEANDAEKFNVHVKNSHLINEEDFNGKTPLLLAVSLNRKEFVAALLKAGADIRKQDSGGRSPLQLALKAEAVDIFEMLLQAGADANLKDSFGNSLLHDLAHVRSKEMQTLLFNTIVRRLDDINGRNFADKTALHIAAELGAAGYISLLASAGANINARLPDGSNILFFCQPDLIPFLIELGADAGMKNNAGNSAFVQARLNADIPRTAAFRKTGLYGSLPREFSVAGKAISIFSAIEEGNLPALAEILRIDGAQINIHDNDLGETPLHKAVAAGNHEMVRLLIESGSDINPVSDFLRTPLHYAATGGDAAIVKMLVEAGADVYFLDARGSTPLHAAAAAGHRRIYQLLVSHGASDSTLDNSGRSPESLLNGR